jgi:hypothetical protein
MKEEGAGALAVRERGERERQRSGMRRRGV